MNRSFLTTFLLTLVLTLSCVAVFNRVMDPSHLFQPQDGRYELGAAQLLAEGHHVANLNNYDDRLLMRFYVKKITKPKDILVFASSRGMEVRQTHFSDHSLFNAGVTGASLHDFLALMQLFKDSSKQPRSLVLVADPWILNRNNGQTRWLTLEDEYRRSLIALQRPVDALGTIPQTTKNQWDRYAQLFSLDYFKNSFKIARQARQSKQNRMYYSTDKTILSDQIRLADGSLSYGSAMRDRSAVDAETQALGYPVFSLDGFTELDAAAQSLLEGWIQDLQLNGISVQLVLMPYHPATYRYFTRETKYHRVMDAQDYFETLPTKLPGVTLQGSYSPSEAGCDATEFYDALHARETCIRKVLGMPRIGQKRK